MWWGFKELTLKEIWKRNPNELKKNDKRKQKDLDIENNWLALRSHSLKDFVKAIGKYENKGYVLHPESFNIGGLYGDQFYVLMEKKEKDDCPKKLLNMLNLFFTFDDDGKRKYSYQDISEMIKR